MKKLSKIPGWSSLCLGFVLLGCATVDMPDHLPEATEVTSTAYGGWTVITTPGKDKHQGELIALEHDTLFIMEQGALTLIPRDSVGSAKIFLTDYPVTTGGAAGWTVAGMLSSLSLGWGAIAAVPLWLIVGSINTAAVANDADAGDLAFPPADLGQFAKFARYPTGLPVDVDRALIRPAPAGPGGEKSVK